MVHRSDAVTMLNRPQAKMRALRRHGAKRVRKIVHGDKVGRPMSQERRIGQITERWWRGRAKTRTGQEIADSFTKRTHAPRATMGSKELGQTLLILGTRFTRTGAKLSLMESYQFQVLDPAIQVLEYKGFALAICDATGEVAFPSWWPSAAIAHLLQPKKKTMSHEWSGTERPPPRFGGTASTCQSRRKHTWMAKSQ